MLKVLWKLIWWVLFGSPKKKEALPTNGLFPTASYTRPPDRKHWIIQDADGKPWVISDLEPDDVWSGNQFVVGPFGNYDLADKAAHELNGKEWKPFQIFYYDGNDEKSKREAEQKATEDCVYHLIQVEETGPWSITDCHPVFGVDFELGPFQSIELAEQACLNLNGYNHFAVKPPGSTFWGVVSGCNTKVGIEDKKIGPFEEYEDAKEFCDSQNAQQANTQSTPSSSSQEKTSGSTSEENESVDPPSPDRL